MNKIASKIYDLALLAYAHFDIALNRVLDWVEKLKR